MTKEQETALARTLEEILKGGTVNVTPEDLDTLRDVTTATPEAEGEPIDALKPAYLNEAVKVSHPIYVYDPKTAVITPDTPTLTRKSEAGLTQEEVNHPDHYSRWPMEPIEFIAVNDLPWWLANVVKYCMRYDAKDGLADMYKGRSYLEMKIRHLEGHPRFWVQPVANERALNGK